MYFIHLFKIMKHWNLRILGYWALGQVTKLKRTWNLAIVSQTVQTITENYCPCLYLSTGQVWWLHDLWFKRYIQKCTLSHLLNTHRGVTDLVNQGMVKNTKTWISWERNITFLQNKKFLCIRWHILRSYHSVTEVTFKFLLSVIRISRFSNSDLCSNR